MGDLFPIVEYQRPKNLRHSNNFYVVSSRTGTTIKSIRKIKKKKCLQSKLFFIRL